MLHQIIKLLDNMATRSMPTSIEHPSMNLLQNLLHTQLSRASLLHITNMNKKWQNHISIQNHRKSI